MDQLLKSDYFYELPEELIAQDPLGDRASSRLMTLNKFTGEIEHKSFRDILDYLHEGDCLVLNDTKVIPARLMGTRKDTGAVIEVLLLKRRDANTWETLVKPGKKAKVGQEIVFGDGILTAKVVGIEEEGNRIIEFSYEGIFEEILDRLGEMPLPPYITHKLEDRNRYQTVYAKNEGSAAAPTAGLHFTNELLDEIRNKGVKVTFVTLHVGLGTFRPVKENNILNHHMHSEWYQVSEESARTINETKENGGRVICVGTTSCRTIESAADDNGIVHAGADNTEIFIYPGYKFKVLDCLITNFHLPESTLIMLVSALAGKEHVLDAYKEAVKEKYRFFSFGDAMFIYDGTYKEIDKNDDFDLSDDSDLETLDLKDVSCLEENPKEEETASKKTGEKHFFKSFLNYIEKLVWFFLLLAYEETVFSFWAFRGFNSYSLLKIALTLPLSVVLSCLVCFFSKKCNRILTRIVSSLVLLYFTINILYHSIFKVFFSIQFMDKTNVKVAQYYREIGEGIVANWLVLVIAILVPILCDIVFSKILPAFLFERVKGKFFFVPIAFFALFIGFSYLCISLYGKSTFSPYELVFLENVNEYSFERIGVFATAEVEIKNLIVPSKEEEEILDEVWVYEDPKKEAEPEIDIKVKDVEVSSNDEKISEPVIDTSPNIWDLDFVALEENEPDEFVAGIHRYMSTVVPTNKNEYTGMFEGFNLIFLTAEGFCPLAVDEQLTPTLYRLTHEGFVFNNFYNPRTGGSTSDGEFVNCTSLLPVKGGAKNFRLVGANSMPLVLGNMFNMKYGITSRAYHNNDYTYYDRDITYPGMGYFYTGKGNGLEVESHWPESDLQMMQLSIPDYIDDDLFHVYYMTVSGHLNYNFSGNWCASKHRDEVADLPYSEACRAYLACQMEFDQALQYLIEQLEEKGIADKTVICFTGDHWPYGLSNEEFSELLGHEVEEKFELYKSNLILWSEAIKEPIVIDKQCASMDILPTLLNLFGFSYDSRLLMGQDILSDSEGFIQFLDRSIITDRMMYNASTGEAISLTGEELTDEYIEACKKKRNLQLKYTERIIDYDYYSYICDALDIDLIKVEQNYTVDYNSDPDTNASNIGNEGQTDIPKEDIPNEDILQEPVPESNP